MRHSWNEYIKEAWPCVFVNLHRSASFVLLRLPAHGFPLRFAFAAAHSYVHHRRDSAQMVTQQASDTMSESLEGDPPRRKVLAWLNPLGTTGQKLLWPGPQVAGTRGGRRGATTHPQICSGWPELLAPTKKPFKFSRPSTSTCPALAIEIS